MFCNKVLVLFCISLVALNVRVTATRKIHPYILREVLKSRLVLIVYTLQKFRGWQKILAMCSGHRFYEFSTNWSIFQPNCSLFVYEEFIFHRSPSQFSRYFDNVTQMHVDA